VKALLLVMAAALTLAAAPAWAGTEVDTVTRKPDGRKRVSKAYFDGERLRVDTSDGRRAIVYRGDTGVIWVIDHKKQNYIEVEKPTADALAGQAQAQLDALPPEKRSHAELGAAVARGIEVRETQRTGKILGVPCKEVQLVSGSMRIADVCQASYADAGVDPATFAAVRDLQELLGGSLSALLPKETREEGMAALESFARLEGVPMRVRTYEEGALDTETVVTRLEKKPIPKGTFALPKGYAPKFSINIRNPSAN